MKQFKRKSSVKPLFGFTLTELLVVVIIIGVLAAVALPKFTRAIETRRTGEAESILSAIRTEQEKRCSLDQPYLGDLTKLDNLLSAAHTANFAYTLQDQGAVAKSQAKNYSLSIPSYKDGRLCCEGEYCNTLNKAYPSCTDLKNEPDFEFSDCMTDEAPADPCAGKTCNGSSVRNCPDGFSGTQTRSCTCGIWSDWAGVCTPADPCAGKTCSGESSRPCPGGLNGTQTRTCECGVWTDWVGSCSCWSGSKERCEGAGIDGALGTWNESTCTCTCQGESVFDDYEGSCVCPPDKEWDDYGRWCMCPSGTVSSGTHCCPSSTPDYNPATGKCERSPCRTDSYKSSHKSECCPSMPKSDSICWTASYNAVWEFTKQVEDRGCGGNYFTSSCGWYGSADNKCPNPGSTCEHRSCGSSGGGGQDWDDQFSGWVKIYTCKGSSATYTRNGW